MRTNSDASSLDDAQSLAKFLHVSVPHIRKLCKLKKLPVIRLGASVRFERQAVVAALREQEQTSTVKEAA